MSAPYGEIVVTNWYHDGQHEVQVDQAPDMALCSVELLQHMHTWRITEPDLINVGIDMTARPPTRDPVWYRITGWDPDHKALIIEREPAPSSPSTPEEPA